MECEPLSSIGPLLGATARAGCKFVSSRLLAAPAGTVCLNRRTPGDGRGDGQNGNNGGNGASLGCAGTQAAAVVVVLAGVQAAPGSMEARGLSLEGR
jgi:hypothetical protein